MSEQIAVNENFDHMLDTTGMRCPLPLLKAKQKLFKMDVNERLLVVSTDENSAADFAKFCSLANYSLILNKKHANKFIFIIEKR